MIVTANFSASALGAFLIWRANRTGKFTLFFLITVVAVFLVLFPIMFFVGGGYHSGMPSFFVFAVVFTVLMLEGRRRAIFTVLEIMLYLGCCLVYFFYPETVIPLASDAEIAKDIIAGCIFTAVTLAFAIWQHLIVYDRKLKQLERLDLERAVLFGNISHEMKTPLSVISAYAQLLKKKLEAMPAPVPAAETEGRGSPPGNSVDDALLIASEANRLGLIVTQALELSRIQEGRGSMIREMKPCHIGEIVAEAVSAHFSGSAAGNNNNRIDLKINEGLPPILADAPRIAQVVVNLVANAVRHSSGGVITVTAFESEKSVALSVRDSGTGISKEEAAMIFDRWYTGAADTGTGLGLYICKHIAEAHGGRISVESEPGKGSCFTVFLPAANI
jgi:signal transduction histidine kinase